MTTIYHSMDGHHRVQECDSKVTQIQKGLENLGELGIFKSKNMSLRKEPQVHLEKIWENNVTTVFLNFPTVWLASPASMSTSQTRGVKQNFSMESLHLVSAISLVGA